MLQKCSVCEREFAVGLYGEKYTTVCPECRAIDEPRMKKETELRSEIIYILTVKMLPSEAIPIVDRILTLFHEAGWRSPEEVEDKIKDTLASIEVFLPEGWPMPLGFDLIAELIKEPQ